MRTISCARFQKTFGLTLVVVSCALLSFAQTTQQETFPSAEKAVQALYAAVQSDNKPAILRVLGSHQDLVSSEDLPTDQHDRALFLEKYEQMHRLVEEPDGTTVLYIGAENWPLPVPLVSREDQWFFDGDAGAREVLFRRIGENEAHAIDACLVLRTGGQVPSGVLHGYYFRKLVGTGKDGGKEVSYLAYPAEYRTSGVMTFVVTPNNVVFEKDLGRQTATVAQTMTRWHADRSWTPAE